MKSGRFFVTSVLILGIAAFTACTGKKDRREAHVKEGNQQIRTAAAVQQELATGSNIHLGNSNAAAFAETFDWNQLTRDQRQTTKEKLAEFVTAVVRTLEIDSKKGIYITRKEVLQAQLNAANAYQKSLETFERTFGENFDPKATKEQTAQVN